MSHCGRCGVGNRNTGWEVVSYNFPFSEPLPSSQSLLKYLFYIPNRTSKGCYVLFDPKYLVTFRHGTHKQYKIGDDVEVAAVEGSPAAGQKFKIVVSTIRENLDFEILKSSSAILQYGPHPH